MRNLKSFEHSIRRTIFYKNNIMYVILAIAAVLMVVILYFPPVRRIFNLGAISMMETLICFGTAFVCVGWFELCKVLSFRRKNIVTIGL